MFMVKQAKHRRSYGNCETEGDQINGSDYRFSLIDLGSATSNTTTMRTALRLSLVTKKPIGRFN